MEEVTLYTDLDNYDEEVDRVIMMTMHSAKGLEFNNVFFCGAEEGIFPGSQVMYYPDEVEEERRLCYVGITRAREELYVTYAKTRMQHGNTQYNQPSRFLKEISESSASFFSIVSESFFEKASVSLLVVTSEIVSEEVFTFSAI